MTISTPAMYSLAQIELKVLTFEQWEQDEIAGLREVLRELCLKYDGAAKLAILATSFEIAIAERQ